MNYTDLVNELKGECEYEEADFVASIPNFFARAEERILRDVDLPAFHQTDQTSTQSANKFLSTPDGYLYSHYLMVNGRMLLPKQVDWIAECYPPGTSNGAPIYYAQWDENSIVMGPTPGAIYDVELRYTRLPETISTADETWLSNNAHRALLYAALVEAAIYMRQDDSVTLAYENSYQDALKGLTIFGELRIKKDNFKERDTRPGAKGE
jgi:hypothetical protein